MPYKDRTGNLQLKLTPEEWEALDRVKASMETVQPGVRVSRAAVVRNLILSADHDLNERFETFISEVSRALGASDLQQHRDLLHVAWEAGREPADAATEFGPYLKRIGAT